MTETNSKEVLDSMIQTYLDGLDSSNKRKVPELEVRFGTGNMARPISKIDSDHVVKQLLGAGFLTNNKEGQHLLRVTPDTVYINNNNESKKSKIRLEIVGIDMIQSYCRHGEDVSEILKLRQVTTSKSIDDLIKFTVKSDVQVPNTSPARYIPSVIYKDMGFNVNYQNEFNSSPLADGNNLLMSGWNELRKTFRFINRVKFSHPEYPINADISIIKSSKKDKGYKYIPEYTMKDAGIFDNSETYEIELELDNEKAKEFDKKGLHDCLRKCIRIVLSGLQQSNYPIGFDERTQVIDKYMKLINGPNYKEALNSYGKPIYRGIETKHFIGPNSITLQINNIIPVNPQLSIPNIRTNYSVTDKADGLRTLLYIADNGRLYLIDMNMNVMFTGSMTKDEKFKNSILDGEFIKHDKGVILNLFASFDIYYLHGKYVGHHDFKTFDIEGSNRKECRHDLLNLFVENLNLEVKNITSDSNNNCVLNIKCKRFIFTDSNNSIFKASMDVLSFNGDNYGKDGLIFTPTNTGVGGSKEPFKTKISWKESFKWKPPQFNTIDFLVKIKQNNFQEDIVRNVDILGNNLQGTSNCLKYKTLELMCGFSSGDTHMDPMGELLNATPIMKSYEYRPANFYPNNPADRSACFCNVLLDDDNHLKIEDGEIIEGDTIVEFKYVLDGTGPTDDDAWKWIPIRNRHDKTAELRNAIRDQINNKKSTPNYGNSYQVANSNWTSIHYPITVPMITRGQDIQINPTENVYYNNDGKNSGINTKRLRDFHNLYVKQSLIKGVSGLSKNKKTLIDYAVGKAGDLSKWIAAKNISFVFGIDVNRDNILNQQNGAYSRYLDVKAESLSSRTELPKALFVVGDSGKNIRDNTAYKKDSEDAQISNAIFGVGEKNEKWKAVAEQYSVAKKGFDISSIQFAIHYFFKDFNSVHQFARNVSQCTCLNGYFIGTCYDGKTVFDILSKKKDSKIVITTKDNQKQILGITKKYSQTAFSADEPCLGYEIDVWQESINQEISEYLVNFTYLVRIMENYGFSLVSSKVAQEAGLPSGSGLFKELFDTMCKNKGNVSSRGIYGTAFDMTKEEKDISFMNRYFVFQKTKNIENAELVQKVMNEELDEHVDIESRNIEVKLMDEKVVIEEEPKVVRIRKSMIKNNKIA